MLPRPWEGGRDPRSEAPAFWSFWGSAICRSHQISHQVFPCHANLLFHLSESNPFPSDENSSELLSCHRFSWECRSFHQPRLCTAPTCPGTQCCICVHSIHGVPDSGSSDSRDLRGTLGWQRAGVRGPLSSSHCHFFSCFVCSQEPICFPQISICFSLSHLFLSLLTSWSRPATS